MCTGYVFASVLCHMFNKSSEWAYRFVSPIIALTAKTQTRLRNMRTKYTTCSNKQLRCISITFFYTTPYHTFTSHKHLCHDGKEDKERRRRKEDEEKRAEDDHISFEIFSQKMPEILTWCLCGNTHCTPSVVLLAFWIGEIVFPTSEFLCPELCHNDQRLVTSGKTLVNFSLCDSLWFFVPFLSFSQLCAKCVEKAFSELRFEAGKVTSAAALSGASLVTVVAFFGAFPKPWLYLRQDADDRNGVRSFCDHWKIKHVTLASAILHLKNPLEKPLRFQAFWSFWACTHTSLL